jgi:hypothetical protein
MRLLAEELPELLGITGTVQGDLLAALTSTLAAENVWTGFGGA